MKRKQVREEAFKTLFMMDLGEINPDQALFYTLDQAPYSTDNRLFLKKLVLGTWESLPEIDVILSRNLINWEIGRLAVSVRTILRMALYEMLFIKETPVAVTINEAIELTKLYQDEEAARFVNGVLDKARLDSTDDHE